jgi:hypothetical protein
MWLALSRQHEIIEDRGKEDGFMMLSQGRPNRGRPFLRLSKLILDSYLSKARNPLSVERCRNQQFRYPGIASEKGSFLRGTGRDKSQGRKWVKLLSKRILDFGFAKGECTVEFREGYDD